MKKTEETVEKKSVETTESKMGPVLTIAMIAAILFVAVAVFVNGCNSSQDKKQSNKDLVVRIDSANQIIADKVDSVGMKIGNDIYTLSGQSTFETNQVIDSIESAKDLIKKKCGKNQKKSVVSKKVYKPYSDTIYVKIINPVSQTVIVDTSKGSSSFGDFTGFVGVGGDAYTTRYGNHLLRVVPKSLYDKYRGNVTPQLNDRYGKYFTLINNYFVVIDDDGGNWCALIRKSASNDYYLPHEIVKDWGYIKGYPEDGRPKKRLIKHFAPLNIAPNGKEISIVRGLDGKDYRGWHYIR